MSTTKIGRRKFLQLSVLAAASVSLASCGTTPGSSNATPAPGDIKRGGTLSMSFGPDFTNLDPYFDVENGEFKPLIFDPIVRQTPDGTAYEPWLAESWQESSDGKSLTLKLRQGVKFHNGRAMTADDIVWSLTYAMDTKPGHHRSDNYLTVDSIQKVDDATVKINYKSVDPGRFAALSVTYIYPKENLKDVATKPIGSGPFMFQEWVSGDHLTAVKNADYWRQGEPYLEKVIIKPLPDQQSRMANLKSGAIDLLMGVPLVDVTTLAGTKGYGTYTMPPGANFYVAMINIAKPPLDNTLVRQAIAHSLDRDKIGKTAMHGVGTPAYLPFPTTSWAYDETLAKKYTFSTDKAKDLLKQAGYANGIKVTMYTRGVGNLFVDIAQVFQQDLAKAGIQVDLQPTEEAAYFEKLMASNFEIVIHQTGSPSLDPSGKFIEAACCRPFRNFMKITDDKNWFPRYEQLVYQGRDTVDQTQRKAIYKEALTILMDQAWAIPIYFSQLTFGFKDYVKGFRCDLAPFVWFNQIYLNK